MISRLDPITTKSLYREFASELQNAGFSGDIQLGYGDRTVLATDNSIYQIMPEGVLYPGSTEDISKIFSLAALKKFHSIVLAPRGGGTGTNGQSLTPGFMLDTSRHMNRVLEINADERWARVQCGAVKDHLNDLAAEQGLFFAPELSTSNRATVGGMVNTDASGQGSVVYGKTRHHVLELISVLPNGTVHHSKPVEKQQLDELCQQPDPIGNIYQTVKNIHEQQQHRVKEVFPVLNRNLTGYDLANIFREDGRFDLNAILCGSEGTLATICEIKVNLLPVPRHSALVLVFYRSFQASLRDAQSLMVARPCSIETIDSRVLGLARKDNVWESVKAFFLEKSTGVDGVNFVEFTGNSEAELEAGIERLIDILQKPADISRINFKVIRETNNVKKIWNMRKQAVGLLGNMKGGARPIAFVEDVAVPPENLADFIQAFRALLDQHQLTYGMFGHVDTGVLHVRPAIDMKDPELEILVRTISDKVAALAQHYGGVLWGEHGKGVRSEYSPAFFADLYPALQKIKQAFDPYNQLNPGKIAIPAGHSGELLKIDGVPTRGQQDRTIEHKSFELFSQSIYCNGNGACFNYNPNSAMCPTWKATHDRIQSPKGRSGLVREWLKLQTAAGTNIAREAWQARQAGLLSDSGQKLVNLVKRWRGEKDFSHEVYSALDNCMSCKSCAGQCPIQVNVPDLRARYFELYHSRYPRPLKHHVAAMLESALPALAKVKPAYNIVMDWPLTNRLSKTSLGLQDLPKITSSHPAKDICLAGASIASTALIDAIPANERDKTLVIVQDAFTSFFETSLLTDLVELLIRLGYRPLVAPYKPNGKVLHVYGYLGRFEKVARTNARELKELSDTGISLVGVDAAITLTYRDEYPETLGDDAPEVMLLSEWFVRQENYLRQLNLTFEGEYILLGHCTETTNVPATPGQWQTLFEFFGLTLKYQATGCCGMAGIYGHETRNQAISRKLYDLSWKAQVENPDNNNRLVATGYSCRSQVKRFGNQAIPHPVQALLKELKAVKG